MPFECGECGAKFSKMNLLQQHQRTLGHRNVFVCNICSKIFYRKDNLQRHLSNHQDGSKYHCEYCGVTFSRDDNLQRHKVKYHNQYGEGETEDKENSPPRKRMKLEPRNKEHKQYDLKVMKEVEVPKFKTKSTHYRITFKSLDITNLPDILKTLKQLFQSILDDITEFIDPLDLVRIALQSPELDYPISLPFTQLRYLTPERILSEIERVLQSFEEFILDDSLDIDLVHVAMPTGGTGKRCKYVDLENMLMDKRCFIRILNTDGIQFDKGVTYRQTSQENYTIRQEFRYKNVD